MDWQTLAAAAIVALTLVVFLVRLGRPRKKTCCGGRCRNGGKNRNSRE